MKTIELMKDEGGRFSVLKNSVAEVKRRGVAVVTFGGAMLAAGQAFATDPVYTSPFATLFDALPIEAVKTDLGTFGAAAIGITIVIAGIGLAKLLMKKAAS